MPDRQEFLNTAPVRSHAPSRSLNSDFAGMDAETIEFLKRSAELAREETPTGLTRSSIFPEQRATSQVATFGSPIGTFPLFSAGGGLFPFELALEAEAQRERALSAQRQELQKSIFENIELQTVKNDLKNRIVLDKQLEAYQDFYDENYDKLLQQGLDSLSARRAVLSSPELKKMQLEWKIFAENYNTTFDDAIGVLQDAAQGKVYDEKTVNSARNFMNLISMEDLNREQIFKASSDLRNRINLAPIAQNVLDAGGFYEDILAFDDELETDDQKILIQSITPSIEKLDDIINSALLLYEDRLSKKDLDTVKGMIKSGVKGRTVEKWQAFSKTDAER